MTARQLRCHIGAALVLTIIVGLSILVGWYIPSLVPRQAPYIAWFLGALSIITLLGYILVSLMLGLADFIDHLATKCERYWDAKGKL